MVQHLPPEQKSAHPVLFLILYLPFGAASGYFTVTLGFLLSKAGVSVEAFSALIALYVVPQTWKVLWAPIIDTTLTAKIWYLISAVAIGVCLLVIAFVPVQPASMPWLTTLALICSAASSVTAMAAERLMAYDTPENQRGRAGGWSQGGNLGGNGLGGGLALWMAYHVSPWSGGAAIGVLSLICCAALFALPEPPKSEEKLNYGRVLWDVAKDVWTIAYSRVGFLTFLLFILPIGTGAASNLWSSLAGDWHADADTVALVNGALGGIVMMVGSIVAGYVTDMIDRKTGYAIFGIILAAVAIGMAEAPRTVEMFVIFTMVYAAIVGGTYAAFSAVTLETIGKGAAATKYNLLACISNVPIAYMTYFNGQAQTRWGSGGMLWFEAIAGVLAIAFFTAVALATRSWAKTAPATA